MTLNKIMLPAATLALALMGLHAVSRASTITTQPGSDCKSYGWSSSAGAAINKNAIFNTAREPSLGVVCPVTRVGPATNGLRVWIDGSAQYGSTVTCTLWSFDYTGLPLASQSFEFTSAYHPDGYAESFDKYLELAPASVPMYSSQVVVCDVPFMGSIYDIEPINL